MKWSVVRRDAHGPALLLDWSSLGPNGRYTVAFTMTVLGPEAGGHSQSVQARLSAYDCGEHTAVALRRYTWRRDGDSMTAEEVKGVMPSRPAPNTVGEAEWQAVCRGSAPAQTLGTIAEAVRFAEAPLPARSAPPR